MNLEKEEYKSSKDLCREIADLKIQLAFQEQFEKEVENILRECESPDAETVKWVHEEEKKLLARISKKTKKKSFNTEKFLKSTAGKVAALVIAFVIVSITSAMAGIQMVRAGVFALDIVGDDRRMSIRAMQEESPVAPEMWGGYYYPTFIPEGFKFAYIDGSGAWYFNEKNDWLVFAENSYGERMSVDTENAKISNVQINGISAMVVEKDRASAIIWTTGKRYFVVDMIGRKEDAMQVAASVIMIK